MRTISLKFALLAAFAAVPLAKADVYHFSFTAAQDPAQGNFSFDLPSSPSISYVDPKGFYSETAVIPITAGGTQILSSTDWYIGGLQFDSGDYELAGATPFTGTLSNPAFQLGRYEMTEFAPNDPADHGVLLVTRVTPEPASLWMLGTGAIGLGASVRRRYIRA